MKKHTGFILFFSALIFIFLGKLILMKAAFLDGDYLAQFYPWSQIYAKALKNFSLPFWTSYFHSGFPLMAEGQVGGFYPLNLIMFLFLPFKTAYNYSVVLHFFLGGMFTYIYSRKIGSNQAGGGLAALIFCFGSGYAGCFYNTVTAKTLIWFPLVLFLLEKYFDGRKNKYLIYSGIILGMQLLAGFAQVAVYSAFFYLIYFISGLAVRKNIRLSDIIRLLGVFIIAALIFYPQFILSWQLVNLSPRIHSSLGFALWGSLSPFNLMSVCFPSLIFYGARFYISIFAVIFLITAFFNFRTEPKLRPIFLLLFLSVFLALGAYNPFYVFFLKLIKFYSFRNPSKLLFFGLFAASVLSGYGFTKFFTDKKADLAKKSLKVFSLILCVMLIVLAIARLAIIFLKDAIIRAGEWYVMHFVAGKQYHRYEVEKYLERVKAFYEQLRQNFSLENIFTVSSIILCLVALLFCVRILRKGKLKPFHKAVFMGMIFADLFIFSFYGTGFRGNIKPFESLKPTHNKILTLLKSDKEIFRVLPFDLTSADMPWWLRPNTNILVGIESIAAYTPLVQNEYKGALSSLEAVDDSLGILSPKDEALTDKYQLLQLLNVKYVVTSRKINFNFAQELILEDKVFLYRLKNCFPRVFFTEYINEETRPSPAGIKVVERRDGFLKLKISTNKAGFIVFSEIYYPGWRAYADGVSKKIIKVKGLVQAVPVDKGSRIIVFQYKPDFLGNK